MRSAQCGRKGGRGGAGAGQCVEERAERRVEGVWVRVEGKRLAGGCGGCGWGPGRRWGFMVRCAGPCGVVCGWCVQSGRVVLRWVCGRCACAGLGVDHVKVRDGTKTLAGP